MWGGVHRNTPIQEGGGGDRAMLLSCEFVLQFFLHLGPLMEKPKANICICIQYSFSLINRTSFSHKIFWRGPQEERRRS